MPELFDRVKYFDLGDARREVCLAWGYKVELSKGSTGDVTEFQHTVSRYIYGIEVSVYKVNSKVGARDVTYVYSDTEHADGVAQIQKVIDDCVVFLEANEVN